MTISLLSILFGSALLLWSAERFVEGSAATAHHFGISPLLIGMVVVGFGTSAPEMVVSALSALQGNPSLALGNAYGSNIANIALILGLTALINPITVHSQVLRRELPILSAMTGLAAWQLWDAIISRGDAIVLLAVFGGLMAWTIRQGVHKKPDTFGSEIEQVIERQTMPIKKALFRLSVGLALLVISSRILVWNAVIIAKKLGIGDLVIGLTIVAVGTSLPELASSLMAARKGAHDIAFGNVLGSNLFNTLAVVGIAGIIHPMTVGREVISRDLPVMAGLTLSLFAIGFGFKGPGRINRFEGALLFSCFVCYVIYLIMGIF